MVLLQGLKCREHDNRGMLEKVQEEKARTAEQGRTWPHALVLARRRGSFYPQLCGDRGADTTRTQKDHLDHKQTRLLEDLLIEVSLCDPENRVHRPRAPLRGDR